MAFGDLTIEITIKEKGKLISKEKVESNNDILDMKVSGVQYLEARITSIGQKVVSKVYSERINP